MVKDKAFYRYIYKRNDGYQLQYKNEHYGFYNRLEDALFDRDRFEQVDWDMEVFVQLPEIPNPYEHMKLPDFNHDADYISIIPTSYKVFKWIDGKSRYFGSYKTLEDARLRRDELISNGWSE